MKKYDKDDLEEIMAEDQNKSQKNSKKGVVKGNTNILEAARSITDKSKMKNVPAIANMDYFKSYTYGVPIRQYPFLCRLLGTDVLALSRSMTVVGMEKSLKSTLAWWLMRPILAANGIVIYLDTEQKQSSDLIRATVDMPEVFNEDNPQVLPIPCDTKEQAQEMLYKFTDKYEELIEGSNRPMGIIWDSLNAGSTEEALESREKQEEQAGYQGYHDAKKMQDTLQDSIAKSINKKPILFVGINHGKEYKRPNGTVEYHEPGGSFKEFAWTWKIRTKRIKQEQRATGTTTIIGIRSDLNALHEEQTVYVPLNFQVKYDEYDVPHARFDWESALSLFLTNPKYFPKQRSSKGICITSPSAGIYNCKELNIEGYDSYQMGKVLSERPDLQERILRKSFHIPKGGILHEGVIYQPYSGHDGKTIERMGKLRGMNIKYGEEPDFVVSKEWLQQNNWPEGMVDE